MDVRKELSEHYLYNLAENLKNGMSKPSATSVRDYLNYLNDLDVEAIRERVAEILADADNELLTSAFSEWAMEDQEIGVSVFFMEDELETVYFGVAFPEDYAKGVDELITANRHGRFNPLHNYFEFVGADFYQVHSFNDLFEESLNFKYFFKEYIDWLIISRDFYNLDSDTNLKLEELFGDYNI